jgi:hypothetical protein
MESAAPTTNEDISARIELRTNLFVLATVAGKDVAGPVKIRNLSPSGALIEGALLPAAGERIELRRGAMIAHGNVAWCQDGRAGMRFDARVKVAEWMPGANTQQQRVDGMVERARTGAIPSFDLADRTAFRFPTLAPAELRRLASALDGLADDLTTETGIVDRYATKLQSLDLAAQVLRRLA